jgi:hypothetical protein
LRETQQVTLLKQEPIDKLKQKNSRYRRFPIVMLYLASIVNGIVQCFEPNPSVVWTVACCVGLSAIHWVQLDAIHRKHPIPRIALQLLLMIWMLFVPIYLIWTRGFRGFGWAVLNLVGIYAMTLISFFTTLLLVYGPQVFRA